MGYRYIGSKNRIINDVMNKIAEIVPKGSVVTDLMCGTASVSSELRKNGNRVIANDIMTYSYHHARVQLLFTAHPQFNNAPEFIDKYYRPSIRPLTPHTPYLKMLVALNNVPQMKGYFWKEFSVDGSPENKTKPRNYFTPTNAMKIDAVRYWINKLKEEKKITDLEHSLLIHDLIMATNDIANIAGTYGHYLSKTNGRANDNFALYQSKLLIINDEGKHRVYQEYAEKIVKNIKCDLCYIDPPYMKRQYAANYHIPETLARGDEPEAVGVSGLRPWRNQYSNFCTKTKIRDSFRQIFSDMDAPHFLLSYSEDGLLKLGEIEELLSEFGKVSIDKIKNKRFKSNNSSLKPIITEYLIHMVAN